MEDCIFCKIARHEIKTEIVAETPDLIVFKDSHPNAPIHYLIVPKKHVESLSDVSDDILIKMKNMMLQLAKDQKLKAFRIVSNWGEYQSVKHLHIHYTSGFKKDDY